MDAIRRIQSFAVYRVCWNENRLTFIAYQMRFDMRLQPIVYRVMIALSMYFGGSYWDTKWAPTVVLRHKSLVNCRLKSKPVFRKSIAYINCNDITGDHSNWLNSWYPNRSIDRSICIVICYYLAALPSFRLEEDVFRLCSLHFFRVCTFSIRCNSCIICWSGKCFINFLLVVFHLWLDTQAV